MKSVVQLAAPAPDWPFCYTWDRPSFSVACQAGEAGSLAAKPRYLNKSSNWIFVSVFWSRYLMITGV